MLPYKVIICGVVKNVEKYIENNIKYCIDTGNLFQDYKIIIYENNSTDNTKQILSKYLDNDKIKISMEDIPYETIKSNSKIWTATFRTGSDHPCRIEQISNARNKVVDEYNKPEYDNYDYIIWIDLDSKGWDLNGIKNSFDCKNDWDAVFSGKNFYDHYAFRLNPNIKHRDPIYNEIENYSELFCIGPESLGQTYWGLRTHFNVNFNKINKLIPVYSAFNGIGIYKKELFKENRYDCMINEDVKALTREFMNHSEFYRYQARMYAKCQKFRSGGHRDDKSNIYWKSNSGYNRPVVCEHVCLNSALIRKNYRLMINPKMSYTRAESV